jgi:hypothetical protein
MPVTRTATRRPRVTLPGTSAVPRPATLQRNGTGFAPASAAVTLPVMLGLDGRHVIVTLSPRGVAAAERARAIGEVVTTNVR